MRVLLNVEGKNTVVEVSSSVKELQGALSQAKSKADRLHQTFSHFSNISILANNALTGFQNLSAGMQPFIDKANAAVVVQTKLKTVMEQRMGASAADVASINKLVSAQTELGVIGGTVQRAGLQQVATFASHRETLETLLPAMNNLVAQQKGLNATSEDAVSIANMVGKALMGNAGAMTRVGITLTDEQKKIIQTGNEGQRAAAIAQAITDNVGQMNAKLAQTDPGKVKQMSNSFGSVQVKIGSFFAQYQDVISGVGQVGMAVAGVTSIATALRGLCTAFGVTTLAGKVWAIAQATFSTAGTFVTAVITGQTISLAALRTGIRATIASLGLIGIAYMAVSTAVEALAGHMGLLGGSTDKATESTRHMTAAQREAAAEGARTRKAVAVSAEAVGDVVGKFKTLQGEWRNLKTTADQTKWIKKNQSAFSGLGLSIGDVTTAQRVFVRNAPKVIEALKAIAEADAFKAEYGKAAVTEAKWQASHKTVVTARPHAGDRVSAEEARAAGLTLSHASRMGHGANAWWRLDDDTAVDAVRQLRIRRAREARNAEGMQYSAASSFWSGKMSEALGRANKAQSFLSSIGSPYRGAEGSLTGRHTGGVAGGSVSAGGEDKDTRTAVERAYEERSAKIKRLQDEYVSTPGRRDEIEKEIAALKAENEQVDELRAKASGEWRAPSAPEPETGTGTSGMSRDNTEAWMSMKRDALNATDMGTKGGMTAAVRIMADMDSMETLRNTVETAMGQGLTLPEDAVQSLYDALFNSEDIPQDKLEEWVESINSALEGKGLGKIELKTDDKGVSKLVSGGKEARSGWQDAARAVQSVGGALSGIEDPAVKIAGTIAQAVAEIALGFASALNNKDSAKGGVWGWIAAAAAGTATMISTISAIKGATRHASGGIVGGHTPSGDLQPVLLNSGELVLNQAQQGVLAERLQSSRPVEDGRMPYLTGEIMWLGLSNYLRGHGYGEIVTTRR